MPENENATASRTDKAVVCDAIVRTRWNDYSVWRRQWPDNTAPTPWMMTSHRLKARTSDEAQTKVRRMFAGCGFHSMSLVAVTAGEDPNNAIASTDLSFTRKP